MLSTDESLYRLLLFTGIILLIIILYNNLVLYRRKLKDFLSLMLLSAVIMCVFEILWNFFTGHPNWGTLIYISACGYVIAFLAFGTFFNCFFLQQFKILPDKKWLRVLLYVIPNVVSLFLCITTHWTRLLFWVDNKGNIQEMILFHTLFYAILLFYLITALIPAIYYAFFTKNENMVTKHIAKNMIAYGIIAPAFYLLQMILLRNPDSDYLALSLTCSVALVFLTTNVNTHLLLETKAKMEAVETELLIASKIQKDILPPGTLDSDTYQGVELYASMNTAKDVGGDFYDYFSIDENRLCFLIADVSGKGTPAALFMMTVKTIINDYALTHESTSEIFNAVNRRLCENNASNMFATSWIGILNMKNMTLQYTNAGHNYPILKQSGKACEQLRDRHGLFLAGMEETKYQQSEIHLHSGDCLFLYTDGVTEAQNQNKEFYGINRLTEALEKTSNQSGKLILDNILADVNDFSNGLPQFDDITMMLLNIR